MENGGCLGSVKQDSLEELPPLFKYITSKAVTGFDVIDESGSANHHRRPNCTPISSPDLSVSKGTETTNSQSHADASPVSYSHCVRSISISMPSSPLGIKRVLLSDEGGVNVDRGVPNSLATSTVINIEQPKQAKFHSQPIPSGTAYAEAIATGEFPNPSEVQQRNPRIDRLKDKRFDSFKTWSGRLERQISHLRGKQLEPELEINVSQNSEIEALPVDRYFDALEGPELETLRASEELVLPKDKQWPFLLRFPISSFGICLGVSSQAILWKNIATSPSTSFLHSGVSISTPTVSTSSLPHG